MVPVSGLRTPAAAPEQPETKQLHNALLVPPPLVLDMALLRGSGGSANWAHSDRAL